MKVLFVIGSLSGGGAEKVLTELVSNLDPLKYQVTVLSIYNKGIYIDQIKKHATYNYIFNDVNISKTRKVYNRIMRKVASLLPSRILYRWFVKDTYDVEIAFLEGISTKVVSGSNNKYSRKFAWVHVDLEKQNWTASNYYSLSHEINCYNRFDNILCVSDSVLDAFKRKYRISDKVSVQYNVVNENDIFLKSVDEINDIKLKSKFKIISIGRLAPQKGYDRLLRVHKRLMENGYKYELWILGEGPERNKLQDYIDKNNLKESVKLLGFKSNPYKYLVKTDLFVCSSITEGFSTVATEAIILGVPVVTTDCAGMEELLGKSEYGLITQNSEEGLFTGLNKILSDKKLYDYYKKQAPVRGRDFRLGTRMREIEELFRGTNN
jgi:glycosyltransferase involved in cell wall biosynthesis